MGALATAADVAAALGLANADALTEAQTARVNPLLAKVSRRFRLEAQRSFTPGTYTHHLKIFAGMVRLEEVPSEVVSVTVPGVTDVSYTLVKNWLLFDDWRSLRINGQDAEVTYTWVAEVPADVVAAVADIVARNLTIDPSSAVAQSTSLSSQSFRQDMAEWASSGEIGMNGDDVALARSYRYPAPPTMILRP